MSYAPPEVAATVWVNSTLAMRTTYFKTTILYVEHAKPITGIRVDGEDSDDYFFDEYLVKHVATRTPDKPGEASELRKEAKRVRVNGIAAWSVEDNGITFLCYENSDLWTLHTFIRSENNYVMSKCLALKITEAHATPPASRPWPMEPATPTAPPSSSDSDWLKGFQTAHLRAELAPTAQRFRELAEHLVADLPAGAFKTQALAALFAAKNAALVSLVPAGP